MAKNNYIALGLMSGTSMDGIDAAIIKTDGYEVQDVIGGSTYPYTETFRDKLRTLIEGKGDRTEIERELTILHAEAANSLLQEQGINSKDIDFIGFHGHTIEHRPYEGITVQIGDGALLQELTGISVINDFRSADVKAGGQGAPLVPVYHRALLSSEVKPVAVVNIGGVANVTWIGKNEDELLAFDTGPGNALLDDWVKSKTGNNFDKGGAFSKSGKVNEILVSKWMGNNFFSIEPPKSLDRNHFASIVNDIEMSTEDGAATLTAFTASSIAAAEKYFPSKVKKWLIAGGGRHNIAIMDRLRNLLPVPVVDIDELRINGDLLEAQAFAFLAVRAYLGLPLSFPGTTGVKKPMCGGIVYRRK